jgi:predicted esterase
MRRAILLLLLVFAGSARAKDDAYEIFLPSNYDAKKTWPIVYALDARGNAEEPLQSLRAAADELGFIIASSYKSASDESNGPNITAMREMWNATHAKLSIDDKRVYIAGFSGTVRAGVILALKAPGTISAIIGAGAGFPPDREPDASMKFAFFGTVGTQDFNYPEMQDLEKKLAAAGIEHRIEEFDGSHEWMPPALGREALAWLTIREMRNGTRPRDAALIEKLWREDISRADAMPILPRWRLLQQLARDYDGLHDTAALGSRMVDAKEYRNAQKKLDRELQDEADALANAERIVATSKTSAEAIRALHIDALKKRTDASAKRILNTLRAQTGFYLPREMHDRGDLAREAYFREIAAAIKESR